MRQNIGLVNSMIRIIAGLTLLSVYTAKLTRKPYKESYILMIMMAAMKVAEGIVRYCPMTELLHKSKEMNDMDLGTIAKEGSPFNPS
ncbi:DUF2892 domain-containing protein [Fictibacillus nanhaiensis]|jgi:Protein of unknown function (DUF2892)|uniref:YgaP family membrane protein n=1 Tax=Fictibacillus nanhaiensis TaxID=742169 RepID=UPI0020409FB4|nr:DUF2892 domain-containing protein [Fictibacillus nanhaiensis]MCM3733226.1 DUF2892 domain-containing protein [Fictibacillus nanhaiensis]